MDFVFILNVVQIVSAILMVLFILLLRSESSVGGAFGGGDVSGENTSKRRGSERIMFTITIVLALIFVSSIAAPVVIY